EWTIFARRALGGLRDERIRPVRNRRATVSGTDRQMAGVHRRRHPAALASRRQGALLRRAGSEVDGGAHYTRRRDLRGWDACASIPSGDPAGSGSGQTTVCRLPRWPIPDQSTRGNIHGRPHYADPELEGQAMNPETPPVSIASLSFANPPQNSVILGR